MRPSALLPASPTPTRPHLPTTVSNSAHPARREARLLDPFMHHTQRRSRLPPSDHHIDRANRFLAAMVFNSSVPNPPRNRHAVSVGKQKVQSPPYQISPARVKLKQEVKESDPRGLSKAKGSSVAKPVALSLVDFSYVLSLVFGGCCS